MSKNSNGCNYVCAGLDTVYSELNGAVEMYPDRFSFESFDSFLKNNVNKFLTSIGSVVTRLTENSAKRMKILSKGRINTSLVDKYTEVLKRFKECRFLKNCEIIVDSGAYSMQVGYFDRTEIPQFIELYNNCFLKEKSDLFDYAFLLDIVPGSSVNIFNSSEDMEELADKSYMLASQLSDEIRSKLFYVQHFRTPLINKVYRELLKKYGTAFSNFSTGGLVSFSRIGTNIPPYLLYAIPLIYIIDHLKDTNIKKFRFHVLGGSEWKEIISHKMFERIIKDLFDIDVQITYDSSTLFRTVCMGRYTYYTDERLRRVGKLILRSTHLDTYDVTQKTKPTSEDLTNYELFCRLINKAISGTGIATVNSENFKIYEYDDESNIDKSDSLLDLMLNSEEKAKSKFSKLAYIYSTLQMLHVFKEVEEWCIEDSERLYKLYSSCKDSSSKYNELVNELDKLMIMLTGGVRVSSNLIRIRSLSLLNSLNLFKEYKESPKDTLQKCDYLISEYMQKDEVLVSKKNIV